MFETGSIKFFLKKKVGQVIVKGPCSTDQWLIFIEVWKVNKKLQDSQRKYLMGPRKNYEKVLNVAAVCLFEVFFNANCQEN